MKMGTLDYQPFFHAVAIAAQFCQQLAPIECHCFCESLLLQIFLKKRDIQLIVAFLAEFHTIGVQAERATHD